MDYLLSGELWAALLTLTALEIVLGIDNLVFLSITSGRLPRHRRAAAQRIGLSLALIMRIALLASAVWLAGMTSPVFTVIDHAVSWRDIILLGGGLFLLIKGTQEIHQAVEGKDEERQVSAGKAAFGIIIMQIVALDLVFSLDSVITAIGMTNNLPVMIVAVTIAILVMLFAAESVSKFIHDHPTTKMLALSFLLLIGMALVADGLHFHIPREYLYFAIAFSLLVEVLNLAVRIRSNANGAANGKPDETASGTASQPSGKSPQP
jgi:predicted tellurium resistance membrane protein TerC